MNYRLNIFGFLVDDKALGANSGDYGLQDQQQRFAGSRTTLPRSAAIRAR
jgi:hypothetical protein